MHFTPRPYQTSAIDAAVKYFNSDAEFNAFEILPTGSGKSVVIANIAKQLHDHGQTLVFQPTKEILEQNFKKFRSYGFRAEIYSASFNSNHVGHVTFAMIGSVIRKKHLFKNVRNVIVDECHLVDGGGGMYHDFIHSLPDAKLLGLTATPYRLSNTPDGTQLEFINRTRPRIFDECLYYIQNSVLFDAGHLAKIEYRVRDVVDRTLIRLNAAGTDFDEKSLQDYYRTIDMPSITAKETLAILKERRSVLVFCASIEEAERVAAQVPGAEVLTGETEKGEREGMLTRFKRNELRVLINVGVLTTGFDYPELEAVLMARSTMSLSLYYQIIGRGMRPHPNKENCLFVDLGGNVTLFGKIESMEIRISEKGHYSIWNTERNKQLTNVPFSRN